MRGTGKTSRDILRAFYSLAAIAVIGTCAALPLMRARKATVKQAEEQQRSIASSYALFQHVVDKNHAGIVKELANNANPDVVSRSPLLGHRPEACALNISIWNSDEQSFRLLLQAGARVDCPVPTPPMTTILTANIASTCKERMLLLLLAHEAPVSELHIDAILEQQLGDVISYLRKQGLPYGPRERCIVGDFAGLKEIISPDNIAEHWSVASFYGTRTLLGIALHCSHVEIAQWLMDTAESVDVDEVHQATALHIAAANNCIPLLAPLVAAGCAVNAGDDTGDSALHYAIFQSTPATVEALIHLGANVNQQNVRLGMWPIHQAARRYERDVREQHSTTDAEAILVALLQAGADIKQPDQQGRLIEELPLENVFNINE